MPIPDPLDYALRKANPEPDELLFRRPFRMTDYAAAASPPAGKPEPEHPIRDAIGRALMGFSRGFAATPATAGYNPIGAGIAGGLAGTGMMLDEEARRARDVEADRFKRSRDVQDQADRDRRLHGYELEQIHARGKETRRGANHRSPRGIPVTVETEARQRAERVLRSSGLHDFSPGYGRALEAEIERQAGIILSRTRGEAPKASASPAPRRPASARESWRDYDR